MSERKILDSALGDIAMTSANAASNIDYKPVAVLPDVKVVKLGGQSLLDRGRAAMFPVLDELVAARKRDVDLLICTGGGNCRDDKNLIIPDDRRSGSLSGNRDFPLHILRRTPLDLTQISVLTDCSIHQDDDESIEATQP